MKKTLTTLVLTCILTMYVAPSLACTSVIVSGKITPDGRPILFKHRDATSGMDNLPVIMQGERYRYIGLFNAGDKARKSAWGGHNETGFAIINTAAYNLNGPKGKDSNGDGRLMRRALEICSSLKDFETLLDTMPRPRDLNSNFGVMDGAGGVAYYETGNETYVKYDVNDPTVAPKGYLMRTNHGMTGVESLKRGVIRYKAISDLMEHAEHEGNINADYLLTHISRHLTHGLTGVNLYDQMPATNEQVTMVPFRDFIPRYTSTATMLIQGILPGETGNMTVNWLIGGFPLCAVAVPLLITDEGIMPAMLTADAHGSSWMCRKSLELKDRLFCVKITNENEYIDLSKLINKQQSGILQQILPVEQEVLSHAHEMLNAVRSSDKRKKRIEALTNFYDWADHYVMSNL